MKYKEWLDILFSNYIEPSSKTKTRERYSEIVEKYLKVKIIERETGKNVTDKNGKGDYGLSKKYFAEAICNERPNFNDFSFSEFNKIFDVIGEIIKDMQVE